jgi:hypothetical protein
VTCLGSLDHLLIFPELVKLSTELEHRIVEGYA